jgi:hypothetical protein
LSRKAGFGQFWGQKFTLNFIQKGDSLLKEKNIFYEPPSEILRRIGEEKEDGMQLAALIALFDEKKYVKIIRQFILKSD